MSTINISVRAGGALLIVKACVKGDDDSFDFSDDETSYIWIWNRQSSINPNQLLKIIIEILQSVHLSSFEEGGIGGGTRNRSLTASLSFPERDPLDRLLVPLIYVTSNKCPAASLYPSKYPTPLTPTKHKG